MERFDYLGLTGMRWRVGDSIFEALPEHGARLMQWKWRGHEVLHWPDSLTSADQIAEAYGGNPVLFPFTARCFVSGEPYQWIDSDGARRSMPMHGFARQGKFVLEEVNENGFTARLVPSAAAMECYPYTYLFRMRYQFSSEQITSTFELENQDCRSIPWSAGHHFYFHMPLIQEVPISEHELELAASKVCLVGLQTGGKLLPQPSYSRQGSLGREKLCEAMIHYGLLSPEVSLTADSGSNKVILTLAIKGEELPPDVYSFVTWSPSLTEPFYCIEPWMGPSNSTEHGMGLHWVQPGERKSFTITVNYFRFQ